MCFTQETRNQRERQTFLACSRGIQVLWTRPRDSASVRDWRPKQVPFASVQLMCERGAVRQEYMIRINKSKVIAKCVASGRPHICFYDVDESTA